MVAHFWPTIDMLISRLSFVFVAVTIGRVIIRWLFYLFIFFRDREIFTVATQIACDEWRNHREANPYRVSARESGVRVFDCVVCSNSAPFHHSNCTLRGISSAKDNGRGEQRGDVGRRCVLTTLIKDSASAGVGRRRGGSAGKSASFAHNAPSAFSTKGAIAFGPESGALFATEFMSAIPYVQSMYIYSLTIGRRVVVGGGLSCLL